MNTAKGQRRAFEYQPRTREQLVEEANASGRKFDSIYLRGFDQFNPKAGQHNVRILPGTWDVRVHYAYEVFLHQYVGANKSNYVCPAKMKNERCPICDAADRMERAGDETFKDIQAKNSYVCWVIDRNDLDPKTKFRPKLWRMSWTMNNNFLKLATASKHGTLNIDDPELGYDIAFQREGKNKNDTKYTALLIEHEKTPIADDNGTFWEIMDYITDNPIPKVLQYYDFEHLQKVITGQVVEADEDDPDDGGTRETQEEDHQDPPPRARTRDAAPETRERPRGRDRALADDEDETGGGEDEGRGNVSARPDRDSTRERPAGNSGGDPGRVRARSASAPARSSGRQETETDEDAGDAPPAQEERRRPRQR